MNGGSDGPGKGEVPLGIPADMLRLARRGLGLPSDWDVVAVVASADGGLASDAERWWPDIAEFLDMHEAVDDLAKL